MRGSELSNGPNGPFRQFSIQSNDQPKSFLERVIESEQNAKLNDLMQHTFSSSKIADPFSTPLGKTENLEPV